MESLFGKTYQLLSSMLDYRAQRQKVITSNLANIDTPLYKPKDVKFPEELKNSLKSEAMKLNKTDPRHLPTEETGTKANYALEETGDKVNLDTEMMNVAENNLMYNMTVELLARKFRGIQNVLKETR